MAPNPLRRDPDPVADAMTNTPRTWFLPPDQQAAGGEDRPVTIGHGQTNSQPTTVANMLQLLEVEPGQAVLDVGAGSGWTTGVLAELVGPQGRVVGVELIAELARQAQAAVERTGRDWAEVRTADPEVLGAPQHGPFDRILVSAEAQSLPGQLVDQLADGGLMVVPVASEMLRVRRRGDQTEVTQHGAYRFVPLINPDG